MPSLPGGASARRQSERCNVTFWKRLFGGAREETGTDRLYRAVVACGRDPAWYTSGGVPDTVDGRFDMIAAVLALVLLRLETGGDAFRKDTVLLAELFVDDMEASLRQIGIGDLVVGKHVTRMMGALGGRLGAFRQAGEDLSEPVRRNVFHESPPSEAALAFVADRLAQFRTRLEGHPLDLLAEGTLPS
jgi:cytochrome b pre-mRNA-processing protein 3